MPTPALFTAAGAITSQQNAISVVSNNIANVNTTANTFELEGEDTSTYDTFTSGSLQLITWGASFDVIQNVQPSGGEFDSIRRASSADRP